MNCKRGVLVEEICDYQLNDEIRAAYEDKSISFEELCALAIEFELVAVPSRMQLAQSAIRALKARQRLNDGGAEILSLIENLYVPTNLKSILKKAYESDEIRNVEDIQAVAEGSIRVRYVSKKRITLLKEALRVKN